jgi:hypothetical protein
MRENRPARSGETHGRKRELEARMAVKTMMIKGVLALP